MLGTSESKESEPVYWQPTNGGETQWPKMWVTDEWMIDLGLVWPLESMRIEYDLAQLGSLGNGSCFWISAALSLGSNVHPRDAMDLIVKAYSENKAAIARWTSGGGAAGDAEDDRDGNKQLQKSEQRLIRERADALKKVLDKAGGPLPGIGSHKSPWGTIPDDPKALAVATHAYVHVYDVSTYENAQVVGERIKARLFTPILTEPTEIFYHVHSDGKNIYLEEDKTSESPRHHIHLVYNGSDHFNAFVLESALKEAL